MENSQAIRYITRFYAHTHLSPISLNTHIIGYLIFPTRIKCLSHDQVTNIPKFQIQIKSNVTNKLLGQMSLNATTQSVVINSLNPGGRYTARVAAQTAGGLGPYSIPAALHMDPSFIARPPK